MKQHPFLFAAALICSTALAQDKPLEESSKSSWEFLSKKYDSNQDGAITLEEYKRGTDTFQRLDTNGDGKLTAQDLENLKRERPRMERGKVPAVGELAPDFKLHPLEPAPKAEELSRKQQAKKPARKETVTKPKPIRLSDFKDKKPVALIFGSYT